jgi:hypothetical protein
MFTKELIEAGKRRCKPVSRISGGTIGVKQTHRAHKIS